MLIIKLLEEFSGRIFIDVYFHLNVFKKQQYLFGRLIVRIKFQSNVVYQKKENNFSNKILGERGR